MNDEDRAHLEAIRRNTDWAAKARKRFVIGIVGLAVAVPAVLAWGSWLVYLSTEVDAAAQATVVSVRQNQWRSRTGGVGTDYCPMLRWEIDGVTVEHESRYCADDETKFSEGQRVAIEFDVDDPSSVVTRSAWDKYSAPVAALPAIALAALFVAACWAGYFEFRRRAREYGQP